jgi:hypothetical protein
MITNNAQALHNLGRYQALASPQLWAIIPFQNRQSMPIHDPDAFWRTKRASKFFLSHLQNIA